MNIDYKHQNDSSATKNDVVLLYNKKYQSNKGNFNGKI